jgi:hypothetical protein
MTTKEIDRIKNAIRHIQTAADVDPWAAEIAVEAMRKQIPQKPKRIDKNKEFDGNWIKICPSCKRALIERITTNEESYVRPYNYSEHCKCGQAIDFGGD